MNGVQRKLAVLYQHQLGRAFQQYLATQLAANAAAGTGHQHDFTRQIARQQRRVWRHRGAAEQILNIEFLKILNCDPARGQIHHARQGADMHGQLTQLLNDRVAAGSCERGHGQQNISYPQTGHSIRHVRSPQDIDPIDAAPDLAGVVIDKPQQHKPAPHAQG